MNDLQSMVYGSPWIFGSNYTDIYGYLVIIVYLIRQMIDLTKKIKYAKDRQLQYEYEMLIFSIAKNMASFMLAWMLSKFGFITERQSHL